MLDFFDQIGTPATSKRKIAFPNAGNHVISSHIMSADIDNIRNETFRFADEIFGFKAFKLECYFLTNHDCPKSSIKVLLVILNFNILPESLFFNNKA